MKTKVFIEKIHGLAGFMIEEDDEDFTVVNLSGVPVCTVSKRCQFAMDTNWEEFEFTDSITQEILLKLIFDYSSTPLEEREEEKKYVYKFPFNVIYETKKDLYVFKILDGGLNLSNAEVHDPKVNNRYHFTNKEVEKFTGKDRELFNVCEKIEVTP